jgi:hypothetical protein
MLALKICSPALEVPEDPLTVTSQGTGKMISRASSSEKGSPKMVFFGLLAMFESKWDRSVMIYIPASEQFAKVVQELRLTKVYPSEKPKAKGLMRRAAGNFRMWDWVRRTGFTMRLVLSALCLRLYVSGLAP